MYLHNVSEHKSFHILIWKKTDSICTEIKSDECQTKSSLKCSCDKKLGVNREKTEKVNLKKSWLARETGLGRIIWVEILPVFYLQPLWVWEYVWEGEREREKKERECMWYVLASVCLLFLWFKAKSTVCCAVWQINFKCLSLLKRGSIEIWRHRWKITDKKDWAFLKTISIKGKISSRNSTFVPIIIIIVKSYHWKSSFF